MSETVDEVFTISLEPDHDRLYDYISDNYEDIQEECVGMGYDLIPPDLGECENWQEKSQKVEAAITEAEEAPKPNWLTYVQEQLVTSGRENELVLISNDPKYDKLVNVIIRAINSPDQTAEYDG